MPGKSGLLVRQCEGFRPKVVPSDCVRISPAVPDATDRYDVITVGVVQEMISDGNAPKSRVYIVTGQAIGRHHLKQIAYGFNLARVDHALIRCRFFLQGQKNPAHIVERCLGDDDPSIKGGHGQPASLRA